MAEERLAVRDERGGALNAEPRGLHTVRVWNVASRREFAILNGHSGPPRHVALSPDGLALATGFDPSGEDFTVGRCQPLKLDPGCVLASGAIEGDQRQ